jgi:hypothetical protein
MSTKRFRPILDYRRSLGTAGETCTGLAPPKEKALSPSPVAHIWRNLLTKLPVRRFILESRASEGFSS